MTELILPAGIERIDEPLPGIKVDTPLASGTLYLNGATVASWIPRGQRDVLWLSAESAYQAGQPIRGGVPLVFPWFGAGPDGDRSPGHGFARITDWLLTETRISRSGAVQLKLMPGEGWADEVAAAGLDGTLRVELNVTMGEVLMIQLIAIAGTRPVTFENALHTYFAVSDVQQVSVEGLDQQVFSDRLTNQCSTQSGPLRITGETDLIFESDRSTEIVDPGWDRRIHITKVGSQQTVVWNPWVDKAAAMPDFGDGEWPQMLCIEAANVREQAIRLEAGERHLLSQTISVQ